MAEGSENEVRGLNALGNPEVTVRTSDGGPEGLNRVGAARPGGILARGSEGSIRKSMGGMRAGKDLLRDGGR